MARHADHPVRDDIDLVAGSSYGPHDPHPTWTWLRRNAPLYFDEGNGVWGAFRYDDLKAISKDPATFSSAGGIRPDAGPVPQMIDMDDPEHWNHRKLVNRGFTPRRVRDQEQAIREICDGIIDTVCERGECDFVTDIAAPLPLIVIGDSLGFAPEDRPDLLRWSDDLMKGLDHSEEGALKMAEAYGAYREYIEALMERRRAEPGDDLLSILVHAEVDGDRLDHEDVIHESLLILIGGDETTRHVISGGMYQLLAHPEQRQLLVERPEVLPSAVEEMLRWVSPIKNMCRTATRDVELRGQTIAAGDKVMLFYPSANRDEEVFDDPFTFDVERSPNEHVAFGFGAHFCLGNSLARLELRVMFEQLLARLPDLHLATDAEPGLRPANFVSGYEEMPVRFTPTAPVGAGA